MASAQSVEQLFRVHGQAVYRVARLIVRDDAMAEDVVQEVFLRLHLAPEKYRSDRGSARSYLLASCRGRAFDALRSEAARSRRQGRVAVPTDHSVTHVEADVDNRELNEVLTTALASLRREEREAILLAYFGGFTYTEVAELLDEAAGTVKSRIRRGLTHLEGHLETFAQPDRI